VDGVTHQGNVENRGEVRLTGTIYLLLSSLAIILLFEKYIASTSLLFLSIGDLMATVVR